MSGSLGIRFRAAVDSESPLQIVGVVNAYCALLAERAGFSAIYLSGAGVANAAFGLPDLGMTSLTNVVEEARRITSASTLPLLVDCDTGWGSPLTIRRTVSEMEQAGVAAIHLEDQVDVKRCGHRDGKVLVTPNEMAGRIEAAATARKDASFVIMARTDAVAVEGLESAIVRARQYVKAGADMIFAEALTDEASMRQFVDAISVPVLINMTEFGKTPLMTTEELKSVGVGIVLYPLSAFRAMSRAAEVVYREIREQGTQRAVVERMQTREELYEALDYYRWEARADDTNSGGE